MNTQVLRQNFAAKTQAARAIAAQFPDGNMPQVKADEIASLLGEADVIKGQIELADRLAKGEEYAAQPQTTPAAFRAAAPNEGNFTFDSKSWREVEVKTALGTKTVRYNTPEAVIKPGYAHAFEAYLRYGKEGLGPQDRKTLSEGVDTAGGFLVPEDYQAQLIKKIQTNTTVRGLARILTTGRDMVRMPRVNYTTDNKYTSGVRASWTGETPSSSTVHRVTDPVFGTIDIPVHTMMASMPITNAVLEDAAFDVSGISSDLLAEAFGLGENDAFLNGSGIAQPMGLLTQVSSTSEAAGIPQYIVSGTSAAITTTADAHSGKRMLDVYYGLPAQYRRQASAAWMVNSATAKEIENLVDGQKRPLITSLISGSMAESAEPSMVKGRPLVIDEFVPDIAANSFPIIFGDWTGYTILDRVGFSVQRASELYIETDITLLVARKRVGGQCTEGYRFRVMKAGTS